MANHNTQLRHSLLYITDGDLQVTRSIVKTTGVDNNLSIHEFVTPPPTAKKPTSVHVLSIYSASVIFEVLFSALPGTRHRQKVDAMKHLSAVLGLFWFPLGEGRANERFRPTLSCIPLLRRKKSRRLNKKTMMF